MTNVANNETFEAKMKTRIRDSIGDLISDKEMIKHYPHNIQDTAIC